MAKITSGILGPITGPIGPVTSRLKLGGYDLEPRFRFPDRKTPAQLEQRRRFSNVMYYGSRYYRQFLKPFFVKPYSEYTALAEFVKINIPRYYEVWNFPSLQGLPNQLGWFRRVWLDHVYDPPNITVYFHAHPDEFPLPTDIIHIAVIDPATKQVYINDYGNYFQEAYWRTGIPFLSLGSQLALVSLIERPQGSSISLISGILDSFWLTR